jgi:uncharacterized protein YjbJ (UPF0337 family)
MLTPLLKRTRGVQHKRTFNMHCSGKLLTRLSQLAKSTEVEQMDKDRVKGTIDDAAGRAKRQVGDWTGDTAAQVEGATQQVKGKVEKAWGNLKDAARDAEHKSDRDRDVVVERDVVMDRDKRNRP